MKNSNASLKVRAEAELELRRRRRERDTSGPPLWNPYPDSPQERAVESEADITGYGGAAGGGKSDWLLGTALTRHRHAIIFRREYPQLRGLIERSREIVDGKGRYNKNESTWRLDDGRVLEFGAVQYEDDREKYRGRPHDYIGFDELTEFTEGIFRFLMGWLRTTVEGQRCRVAATFNPPTSDHQRWVVRFFAPWLDRKHPNPAMPGELRWFAMVDGEEVERPDGEPFDHAGERITPTSRTFFPARLADNPILAATGYMRTLMSMPEPMRSQLAYGDFDASVEDDPWQVIPTAWVRAAMGRWNALGGDSYRPPVRQTCIGSDVAHGGKDQSVNAPRYGDWFARLDKHKGVDTPTGKSAAALVVKLYQPGSFVNVDGIGYGASAAEKLSDPPIHGGYGLPAVAVNVSERSEHTDRSGKYRMVNKRAEMYWRLREALDPEFGSEMALPDDPELLADLTSPTYEILPSGIKVESKDDIKARLGRSPDCGDAVALTMLEPPASGPAIMGGADKHLVGPRPAMPASPPYRPGEQPPRPTLGPRAGQLGFPGSRR